MSGVRAVVRRHRFATYVVLAYGFAWSCWLPLVLSGSVVWQGVGRPTDLPGLMGPALAAAITLSLVGGRPALADWGRRIVRYRVPAWCWVFIVLTLVVNGFGEEAGWRGYLADGLLGRHGLLRTASLVALVWAGWHLPLFLVLDSFRGLGFEVVGWVIGLYAGSIVLTWLYAASGRSILVVALWHTAYTFTSATAAMSGLPAAVTSTAVMVVAAVVVVVLVRKNNAEQALGPSRSAAEPRTLVSWSRDDTGS